MRLIRFLIVSAAVVTASLLKNSSCRKWALPLLGPTIAYVVRSVGESTLEFRKGSPTH
jgi:hypothetical protein